MAEFFFSTDGTFTTTPAISYSGPDKWTVRDAVYAYSSNADAVSSNFDGSILVNNGNIHSGMSVGVHFSASGSIINNAGHNIVGVVGVRAADGSILNHGQILGLRGDGIDIADDSGNKNSVFNDGYVFGRDAGIHWENFGGGAFNNAGTLKADSWGVRLDTLPGVLVTLTNSGTIAGTLSAIFTTSGRISLTNTGTIKGNVICTSGTEADLIVNKHTIAGVIDLGGGKDVFNGLAGTAAQVSGEAGNDTLLGGRGVDKFDGGDGNDTLQIIGAQAQFDTLKGGAQFDTLQVLGAAPAILNGFNAAAQGIEAWKGNNHGLLGNGKANVFVLAGLNGKTGLPFADGAGGNDTLVGSRLADDLRGNSGNDSLSGGAAADILTGGTGKDMLTGGAGPDIFRFIASNETSANAAAADLIQDFTQTGREHDRIDLSQIDANGSLAGHQHFQFIGTKAFTANQPGDVREFFQGGNTFVAINTDDDTQAEALIQLHGHFALHTGAAGDFIL
jgi:Ca2+-binding RTX toxin-like protein